MPKGSNFPKRVWRKGCAPDVTVKDNPDWTKIINADSPEVELLGVEWFENPACVVEKKAPTAEDIATITALVESKDEEIARLRAQLEANNAAAMQSSEDVQKSNNSIEDKLRKEAAEAEAALRSKSPKKG